MFANLVQAGFQGEDPRGESRRRRGAVRPPAVPLHRRDPLVPSTLASSSSLRTPSSKGSRRLAAKGMRAGIVISAGFKEIGGAGVALERSLLEAARIRGGPGAGPELPRPDQHARLAERLVLPRDAPEGVHLLLLPIRGALHRGARLGHRPERRLLQIREPREQGRRLGVGHPRVPRRRSVDPGHPRVRREHRRRTPVPPRGPERDAPQAGRHREGRRHRRGRARRLLPHRQPRRVGPRLRGGVPAGRGAPGGDGGGSLRPGPRFRDAAAPPGGSPPDPDERGRSGDPRGGHRFAPRHSPPRRLRLPSGPDPSRAASHGERLANPVDIVGDARADRYRIVLARSGTSRWSTPSSSC